MDGYVRLTLSTEKYLAHLRSASSSATPPPFSAAEVTTLVHAGLLTRSPDSQQPSSLPTTSAPSSLHSLSKAGSSNPSGSVEAVGGRDAFHNAGGGLSTSAPIARNDRRADYLLSLPNTGPLLKLITDARTCLLELLGRCRRGIGRRR